MDTPHQVTVVMPVVTKRPKEALLMGDAESIVWHEVSLAFKVPTEQGRFSFRW